MSTILLPDGLVGVPEPRVDYQVPAVSHEAGDMAIALAESVGIHLYPWQQYAVRAILGEDGRQRWAAFEAAIAVARQNGKGEVLLVVELAGLFLFGEELILHSSHWFPTSKDAFRRVRDVIEGSRDLSRRVKAMRSGNNEVGVELLTGQRLRFIARTSSSGRGLTADRLILDEAQILSVDTMGALLPTLSARPNPQIVYAFTVPRHEDESDHVESLRDRALAGDDPGLTYLGWTHDLAPEDAAMIDLDDRALWTAANPAVGHRIDESQVAAERRALPDDEFARERISVWPVGGGTSLVDMDRWRKLVGTESTRPDPVALAVTMSADRQWASIELAGERVDGGTQVQVVQSGKGSTWVVERVVELVSAHSPVGVAVDPSGPEGSLIGPLKDAGVDVSTFSPQRYAQGCGEFVDAVAAGTVRHSGEKVLSIAVETAKRQRLGGTWAFADGDGMDSSPLRGVVLAMLALRAGRQTKKRSGKVW